MSRDVVDDFGRLKDFFTKYSTSVNIGKAAFVKFLSSYHKKYLAYLTYVAELSAYKTNDALSGLSEKQFDYLSESCSDCGLALFDAVNGNYKASRLLLRSSIENFLKGISLDEDVTIDRESSVFKLFGRVKTITFFATSVVNLKLFDIIHQEYKELCRDVHTATVANMTQLSALKTFPAFDQKQADALMRIAKKLITSYVTLIALKYNSHYHSIGYVNKEVIENSVIQDFADVINNK